MPLPAIQAQNLNFSYPGAPPVRAVAGLELLIYPGEIVALLGPSGCGKTTVLKLLAGLLDPTAGTVEINGKSTAKAKVARESGLVFQHPILLPWRTVRQNILLPLQLRSANGRLRNGRPTDLETLVCEAARLVGL